MNEIEMIFIVNILDMHLFSHIKASHLAVTSFVPFALRVIQKDKS